MENDNWFLIGDIHGDAAPVREFYEKNREKLSSDARENHLILLGDFGANFALRGQRDYKFKRTLSEYPFTYIALRGNHEARVQTVINLFPQQWKAVSKYGGQIYREKEFPQIEYLSDEPAVYEFCGYKTFSIQHDRANASSNALSQCRNFDRRKRSNQSCTECFNN